MEESIIKFTEFKGIVRSMANPPPNTLYECKNISVDSVLGGLIPRKGIKAIELESKDVDGFVYHRLDDIDCRVTLAEGHVYSKPFIYGGLGTNPDQLIDNDEAVTGTLKLLAPENNGTKAQGYFEFPNPVQIGNVLGLGTITWRELYTHNGVQVGIRTIKGTDTKFTEQLYVGDKVTFNGQSTRSDAAWEEHTYTVDEIVSNTILLVTKGISLRKPIVKQSYTYTRYITGNPANNDTVSIGADTYTFKTTAVGTFDVEISSLDNVGTTVQRLVNKINTVRTVPATASLYMNSNNNTVRCNIEYNTTGTAGNSVTLAKSSSNITLSAATLLGGSSPILSVKSIATNLMTLAQGHPVNNGWFKYAIVRNMTGVLSPDKRYAVVTEVSDSVEPILTLNKDISSAWTTGDSYIFYKSELMAKQFDSSNKPVDALSLDYHLNTPFHTNGLGGKNDLGLYGVSAYNKPLWIGKISNRSYFDNAFKFNGIYCTSLFDDVTADVIQASFNPLKCKVDVVTAPTTPQANVFQFSFSLKYDGFNESKLYDETITGVGPVSNDTLAITNIVFFRDISINPPLNPSLESFYTEDPYELALPTKNSDASTVYTKATIRIELKYPELINRRITDLVIYSRQLYLDFSASQRVIAKYAWRRVKTVSINDAGWEYDASTGRYYIDVVINADMLGGELFVDKNKFATSDVLTRDVVTAININRRMFAVDITNRQIVYYSPINDNGECQSLLPSSSFFLVNKIVGDIKRLYTLNDRLIVFKKNCMFTIAIDSSPLTPKDEYISNEVGLAGFNSIIVANRIMYFVSYSGIYRTDGFKVDNVPLNIAWISDFRDYTDSEKEDSMSFYDSLTQKCYFYIKDIFWVYSTRDNTWSRESFEHTYLDVIYGRPELIARDENDTVIYDGLEYLQFPSASYIDEVLVGSARTELSYSVDLESNDIESPNGLDYAMHCNRGYIRGENNTGLTLTLKQSSLVAASQTISANRYTFPLRTTSPMNRFRLLINATISGKLTLKEIGLHMKFIRRGGSTKVLS